MNPSDIWQVLLMGDQHIAGHLSTQNQRCTSMPYMRYEPMIPVFKWSVA